MLFNPGVAPQASDFGYPEVPPPPVVMSRFTSEERLRLVCRWHNELRRARGLKVAPRRNQQAPMLGGLRVLEEGRVSPVDWLRFVAGLPNGPKMGLHAAFSPTFVERHLRWCRQLYGAHTGYLLTGPAYTHYVEPWWAAVGYARRAPDQAAAFERELARVGAERVAAEMEAARFRERVETRFQTGAWVWSTFVQRLGSTCEPSAETDDQL